MGVVLTTDRGPMAILCVCPSWSRSGGGYMAHFAGSDASVFGDLSLRRL